MQLLRKEVIKRHVTCVEGIKELIYVYQVWRWLGRSAGRSSDSLPESRRFECYLIKISTISSINKKCFQKIW